MFRDKHRNVVLTFVAGRLTGEEEVKLLKVRGFRISDKAESCLKSIKYGTDHCLNDGDVYRIVVVPGSAITRDCYRTTRTLLKFGDMWGYGKPRAGLISGILGDSKELIKEMEIKIIVCLHDPINSLVLCVRHDDILDDLLVDVTEAASDGTLWSGKTTAFIFPIPIPTATPILHSQR